MITKEPEFRVGRKGKWVLTEPMIYVNTATTGRIEIPVGFETDLASIPKLFRNIIDVNGRHRLAAVLHDYLYSRAGVLVSGRRLTRKACDNEFLHVMRLSGVPTIRRRLMYQAVRLGGGFSWPSKATRLGY